LDPALDSRGARALLFSTFIFFQPCQPIPAEDDAPDFDGLVFHEGENGLTPGDQLMVTVEEANGTIFGPTRRP
jgi:hypothetical protein